MNPQHALAEVLVDELVRLGVGEAVLAPGSRSAPLAYALHAADAAGRLRVHVRVDERSAAFLALGLAKATGVPAPVVTTSGTAVANLVPAVLEAHESGVPMILLTADRPPELRGTRANQTTDQLAFFGRMVRWFHDLGVPEPRPGARAAWRTAMDRAMAAATGGTGAEPGPVHVDVPLRDPLAPGIGADDDAAWPEALDGRDGGRPWTETTTRPQGELSAWTSPPLPALARTLVIIGDAPTAVQRAAAEWAARRCHPVIGEPFGPALTDGSVGRLPHGVRLAGSVQGGRHDDLLPDRIVVVGRLTLSRSLAGLLRLPGVQVDLVTADRRWPDPGHVVAAVHDPGAFSGDDLTVHRGPGGAGLGDPGGLADKSRADGASRASTPEDAAGGAPGDLTSPRGSVSVEAQEYRAAWTRLAQEVSLEIESTVAWPSGAALAMTVLESLPEHALLFLGSSNGVRHVDLVRGLHGPDRAEVVASRGLAGIDGCVSTATGLALGSGRPTYALLGDLTFLHDANGLLIGPHEPCPDLTIVVGNDDGGAIFGDLEYGQAARRDAYPGVLERMFLTPTGTRLGRLCEAHGVRHVLARTPEELTVAVTPAPRGITVVEVSLPGHPPVDPKSR